MHKDLDAWLEDYGQMPLIQVQMAPAVVKLVETLLTRSGTEIELHPTDLGEGEPPTLTAVPSGALVRRLMGIGPTSAAVDGGLAGDSPAPDALEQMTGFYRRPLTEISEMPPDYWHD